MNDGQTITNRVTPILKTKYIFFIFLFPLSARSHALRGNAVCDVLRPGPIAPAPQSLRRRGASQTAFPRRALVIPEIMHLREKLVSKRTYGSACNPYSESCIHRCTKFGWVHVAEKPPSP